jgi:hypothetical protein
VARRPRHLRPRHHQVGLNIALASHRHREKPVRISTIKRDQPMSTSSTGCYGTAAALAGQLDLREDQRILYESLEEEKRADELLTLLAKREVNPDSVSAFAINPAAS